MAKKSRVRGEMKGNSPMVSFRAERELHDRLVAYAARVERKMADAVRRLVVKALEREEAR